MSTKKPIWGWDVEAMTENGEWEWACASGQNRDGAVADAKRELRNGAKRVRIVPLYAGEPEEIEEP